MLISAQFNRLIDFQDFYLPIFIRVKNFPRCQQLQLLSVEKFQFLVNCE